MKTIQNAFLLFSVIGILQACKSTTTIPPAQSTETSQSAENKPAQGVTASGVLLEQGVSTYQYGTHVLNDKEGKTMYALKSETIKLNMYIGKQVELQGIPVEGYPVEGGPEYLEVIKIK